jgi:MFS family permease
LPARAGPIRIRVRINMSDKLDQQTEAPSMPGATASTTAPGGALGKLLLAVMFGGFISIGLLDGGGGVLWPEVTDAFEISDGLFGLASGIGLLVAFPIMMLAGKIADRFDRRSLLLAAFLGLTLTALLMAFGSAGGALLLIGILALRGLSVSLIDLGNNAIAIDFERSSGRHIMGPLHATYSAGALVGALGVWGIFALGGGYRAVYVLFALFFVSLAVVAVRTRALPPLPSVRTEPVSVMATFHLLRKRDIRLLGAITACGMFGTILFSQWVGLYLRDVRDAGESARVLAVVVYGAMMVIGRLVNGPVVQRLGVRRAFAADGTLAAAGGLVVSLDVPLWLAIAGCGLAGLGLAGIMPLALSTGGARFPREGAAVPGAVLLIGYTGLAAGPLLAGLTASLISDAAVMLLTAIAGLLIVLVAILLSESGGARTVSSAT